MTNILKPKNPDPIFTLQQYATKKPDFHECRVFEIFDMKAFKLI